MMSGNIPIIQRQIAIRISADGQLFAIQDKFPGLPVSFLDHQERYIMVTGRNTDLFFCIVPVCGNRNHSRIGAVLAHKVLPCYSSSSILE